MASPTIDGEGKAAAPPTSEPAPPTLPTAAPTISSTQHLDSALQQLQQQYNDPTIQLLAQGAEGRIYSLPTSSYTAVHPHAITSSTTTLPSHLIIKERFPKMYRHSKLDTKLIQQHLQTEQRLLQKCSKAHLHVPTVYTTTMTASSEHKGRKVGQIVMSKVMNSITVRQYIHHLHTVRSHHPHLHAAVQTALLEVCYSLGHTLSQMHRLGVVHGDLTTSNMMVTLRDISNNDDIVLDSNSVPELRIAEGNTTTKHNTVDTPSHNGVATPSLSNTPPASVISNNTASELDFANELQNYRPSQYPLITLIDFGLSSISHSIEDKAVDLYVLERAFQATHPQSEKLFVAVLKGYRTHDTDKTMTRLDAVRKRGRKRSMVG